MRSLVAISLLINLYPLSDFCIDQLLIITDSCKVNKCSTVQHSEKKNASNTSASIIKADKPKPTPVLPFYNFDMKINLW